MQEFKDREDFKEGAQRLDGLTSSYQADKRYLIFIKKYQVSRKELILILRIFDGTKIWMQKVDRGTIDEMKKRSDIQGSYYSFCELLKSSIDTKKYELIQFGNDLSVLFYFQLTNNVQLKGTLEMSQGVPIIGDKDTLKLSSDFLFDLYDGLKSNQIIYTTAKEEPKLSKKKVTEKVVDIEKILERKAPPPKKDLFAMGQEVFSGEEPIQLKEKNRQNIIMPTQKKRKTDGAKID